MDVKSVVTTEEAVRGFYPTPPDLAEKLLDGIDWNSVENVLEPSAGKGDLVAAVMRKVFAWTERRYYTDPLSVDCVELDPHLRAVLKYEWGGERECEIKDRLYELDQKKVYRYETGEREKLSPEEAQEETRLIQERNQREAVEVHIVCDDFLSFSTRKHYDLIVMNPPFADGDRHLLQALELAEKSGGEVRCILNAETILNPYTNRRKLLTEKLRQMDAEVSYVEHGFSDAERQTDVTVAVIRAKAEEKKKTSAIYDRLKKAAAYEEPTQQVTDLALEDFLENVVARFNLELDAGMALIDEFNAMAPYLLENEDPEDKYKSTLLLLSVGGTDRVYSAPSKNKFVRLVRKKYWKALFSNREFMGRMTSNIRERYSAMVDKMQDYDFSLFNIQQVTTEMNAELSHGIQETIVALFDKMTEEHSWYPEMQKNIHYFNGWRTNQVHKINRKVILPTYGMFASYSRNKETFDLHKAETTISDIEKVFYYLDGDMTAEVDLHGVLKRAHDEGQTKNIQCRYFSVTLYKKGTMHIKFHSQDLVDRFNIYCCKQKNWLPPFYGKRKYEDLSREEQTVVDEFQGREAYDGVLRRADYFLAPVSSGKPLLALGE